MGASSPLSLDHLVLFDGVCNLCAASVQFIIDRDPSARFKFASLQSSFAKNLLKQYGVNDQHEELSSIVLIEDNQIFTRSEAALRIARHLKGLWPALYLFKIVPRIIRDSVYNWIARKRYKMFGRKDACMVPTPELRLRFPE